MLESILIASGIKNDVSWRRFLTRWMFVSFLLHIVGAVFSSGFYHADEHFQILEFMSFKLGLSPQNELPLEFDHQLRPWLIPAVFAGLTKGMMTLGIQNPFHWAFGYRLFSSFLGWMSTVGLSLCSYFWISNQEWRKKAVVAMALLWYVPSFHARHSSENIGGSFFFLGVALLSLTLVVLNQFPAQLKRNGTLALFSTGFLFGLGFEARFQVGFLILGALAWYLFIARASLKNVIWVSIGIGIPIGVGVLADRWGYGQWTFTPWNYLKYNIIQNHVADMDATPWWDYFRRAVTESWPVLGILLLLSFVTAWIRNPKHILTWSCSTFFLVHEIIGHKELRFLFPLLHAGGMLVIFAFRPFANPPSKVTNPFLRKTKNIRFASIQVGLFGLNLIALFCLTLIPAWMPMRFYSQLYSFKPEGFRLYLKDDSLFNFGGALMNFYRPPRLEVQKLSDYSQFYTLLQKETGPHWLFYSRYTLPDDAAQLRKICSVEFSTLPKWLENTPIRNRLKQVTNWTLFQCNGPS